jgi:heme oxygenase
MPAEPPVDLSLRLRHETLELHRDIERRIGFPDSVKDLTAYRSCLVSYFRLYCTIEASLAEFEGWQANGIPLEERLQVPRLVQDLEALDIKPASCAAAGQQWAPPMPDFSHAMGVFYVLEGSTLGGQFILRRLRAVLGDRIEGADAFFGGHAAKSGAMWNAARQAIDAYGQKHPEQCESVIEGASSTFHAVGNWMTRHE